MPLFSPIFVLLYFLQLSSCEETYENSTHICDRCKCNDAQIFTIDCSNLNLNNMLAMYPSQKSKIRAIFTGNHFEQLEKLPPTESEVEIILSKCNIHSLDPAVFEEATQTKLVDLSYNSLISEELVSDRFRGPFVDNKPTSIGIEDLNLAYNQIHTLYKDVFEFLPNLTRLNLEGNDFKVLDMQTQLALAKVPGLTYLNLANNELTDLVGGALESLKNLNELDLSKNDLDFVPKSLELVKQSLQILVLDKNPIFELNAETFTELTNLIQISANNLTRLRSIDANTFATTLKLTKLSLCNNSALRDIDSQAFNINSIIRELYLNNNSLTVLPLSLANLSSLAIVDFQNNPLLCTCQLYTIAGALSQSTIRTNGGPTCTDPTATTVPPSRVYSLSSDICEAKVVDGVNGRSITGGTNSQFRRISVPLAGLIVVLMIASFAAIAMAFSRYRRFMQGRNQEFSSQVMYSPLLSTYSRA